MSKCVTDDPRRYFATARRIRIHRIPKSARPNKFQKTRGKIETRRANAEKQEAENAIQVRRDAWTAKIPRKNLAATTITMRNTKRRRRRKDGECEAQSHWNLHQQDLQKRHHSILHHLFHLETEFLDFSPKNKELSSNWKRNFSNECRNVVSK